MWANAELPKGTLIIRGNPNYFNKLCFLNGVSSKTHDALGMTLVMPLRERSSIGEASRREAAQTYPLSHHRILGLSSSVRTLLHYWFSPP